MTRWNFKSLKFENIPQVFQEYPTHEVSTAMMGSLSHIKTLHIHYVVTANIQFQRVASYFWCHVLALHTTLSFLFGGCPFQRCSCLQIIIWNIKCLGDLVSEVSGIGFAWCLFVRTVENWWKFILDTNMLKPHNYPSKITKLRLRIAEKKTLNDVDIVDIEWFTSHQITGLSPLKNDFLHHFLSWKTCSSCNCTACRSSAKRNSCAKTVSWKPGETAWDWQHFRVGWNYFD